MFKKWNHVLFTVLFLSALILPLLFAKWESGGVSEDENRNLAAFPSVMEGGSFNPSFTGDFETWFTDHLGFRNILIDANTTLMQRVFDRSLTTNDWKIGKTGDVIYAPDSIVKDYAHVNLRTESEVARIGNSYQTVSDWLAEKDIPFIYVQCVDKHTVYPERFIASVRQIGTTSKTDQVLEYLQNETTVNTVYFKQILWDNRERHAVFSHWGDATHWTHRGAFICYTYLMEQLNRCTGTPLRILQEADYNITYTTHYSPEGASEQEEVFDIKSPQAAKTDVAPLGEWAGDHRHSIRKNPEAGNTLRLLIVGDSYFNSYLVDDIAESFGEVWMVWGDYTRDLPEIVDLCDPDMVIFQCAERVDRSNAICALAEKLRQ